MIINWKPTILYQYE